MRRLVDLLVWLPDEIGTTGYRASDTVLPRGQMARTRRRDRPQLGDPSARRAYRGRRGRPTLDALGEVFDRCFDVPRMTALSDVAGFVQQAQGMGALTFRSSMWST